MKVRIALGICGTLLVGCAIGYTPLVTPNPEQPQHQNSDPNRSALTEGVNPDELERMAAELSPSKIVLNPRLEIQSIVDKYIASKLKTSEITNVNVKLTTVEELNGLTGASDGPYTPDSQVYLLTVEGNIEWPEGAWTKTEVKTGLPTGEQLKGKTYYVEFSAQSGETLRFFMPKS